MSENLEQNKLIQNQYENNERFNTIDNERQKAVQNEGLTMMMQGQGDTVENNKDQIAAFDRMKQEDSQRRSYYQENGPYNQSQQTHRHSNERSIQHNYYKRKYYQSREENEQEQLYEQRRFSNKEQQSQRLTSVNEGRRNSTERKITFADKFNKDYPNEHNRHYGNYYKKHYKYEKSFNRDHKQSYYKKYY